LSVLKTPIKNPLLAYCLTLAYASLIVTGAFVCQDLLTRLGEDWSEHLIIFVIVAGTITLTIYTASFKCVLFSIMGFQSGILIPVLLIRQFSEYEIDWPKVWIILIVASVGTLIAAVMHRFAKQRKTQRRERTSMKKVTWGILSTAKIGREKVIPAMLKSQYGEVLALASREEDKALAAARALGLARAYGSYEALLADPDIQAIYNPLPNHLHVPWTLKALEAGKHVLCEKPLAMTVTEAEALVKAAKDFPDLKVMEAFMYRFHPQWIRAKDLVDQGAIGDLRTVQSFFSYTNTDAGNIRNIDAYGGGGLMDIGCYCISLSRFLFDAEPIHVTGSVENDPEFNIDRIASGILEFERGTATFTCATQLAPYQRVNIFGTTGRIEIEIPFNAPEAPCRLWLQQGQDTREIPLHPANQYTLQCDAFSKAILEDTPVPTPLEDAVNNMRVIEAIKEANAG
jgi:predicted dehydrogenase